MKRLLLAVLIGVALSGCAQFNRIFNIASNETPLVVVANGEVKEVTPDPLRFSNERGKVTIYWQAPSGYRFSAKNGIFINGELIGGPRGKLEPNQNEVVECGPANAERSEFSCFNRNSRPGTYKYTVNLETAEGKPLKPFDPSIINGRDM